jgi:hypothetical protein
VFADAGNGNWVDITSQLIDGTSGLEPGMTIRIVISATADATAARVRITFDTTTSGWTPDITDRDASGNFYYDYVLPGYGSFMIESEVLIGGVWR